MTAHLPIPAARPAPVDDDQLAALVRVTDQISSGTATEEGILWFMSCAAPCLRELQQRRAAAAQAVQALTDGNVVTLTRSGR
jgi:hypothetical protein